MKKLFALALMLIVFCVGNTSTIPVKALPGVLNVGPGQPFATIEAALAVAVPGDVIHVWNKAAGGYYIENPTVNVPNVTIIGQSTANVIVGVAVPGICFGITAPNVAIIGLTIVGMTNLGSSGIHIFPSSAQCRIYGNRITQFDHGVTIDNSADNTIMGNQIDYCWAIIGEPPDCSCGVLIQGPSATNNMIRGNDFGWNNPNWYQIGTLGASGNTIKFNNFVYSPQNRPQAFVSQGDVNTWDDINLQKGNFWGDNMPKPPYVIDPNNIDHFCSPGLGIYNWPAQRFDINRDFKCDIIDVATVSVAFGTTWSTPKWNPIADVYPDRKIDIKDVAAVAVKYGWSDP